MRAIPAQRLLGAHAKQSRVIFKSDSDRILTVPPLLVFSPVMYLPAVVAKAKALAELAFGSSDMLGIKRTAGHGLLNQEADVLAIDGTAPGILRAALLTRASEMVFGFSGDKEIQIDLGAVLQLYRDARHQAILAGELADELPIGDLSFDFGSLKTVQEPGSFHA